MFTIKFVEPRREFSVECVSYEFREDADGVARLFGYDTAQPRGDDYSSFFAGVKAPGPGPAMKSAFVMNRFGSTIASFHWWIENAKDSPLASAGGQPEYTADPIDPSDLVPA